MSTLNMVVERISRAVDGTDVANVLGHVPVSLRSLDIHSPITGTFPVLSAGQDTLGRLDVVLSVSYTPLVSSFELNEHFASVDFSLPIFPTPNAAGQPAGSNAARSDGAELEERDDTADDVLDIFELVERVLARRQVRLVEVFREADRQGAGLLGFAEIKGMLAKLLPERSAGLHARYVLLMLDGNEDARVSYQEFSEAIREFAEAARCVRTGKDRMVAQTLQPLAIRLSQHLLDVQKAFWEVDITQRGSLSYAQLVKLLRNVAPGVTRRQERFLLAKLSQAVDGGRVTMEALKEVVRWVMDVDAYPPEDFVPKPRRAASRQRPARSFERLKSKGKRPADTSPEPGKPYETLSLASAQQAQQPGSRPQRASPGATPQSYPAEDADAVAGIRGVLVVVHSLETTLEDNGRLRLFAKALHPGGSNAELSREPSAASAAAHSAAWQAALPAPASWGSELPDRAQPTLVIEVGEELGALAAPAPASRPASPDASVPAGPAMPAGVGRAEHPGRLLGVVRVPLQLPSKTADADDDACTLAQGQYAIRDVLRGVDRGSLRVHAQLLSGPAGGPEASKQAQPGAQPIAVRHAFDVSLISLNRLPSAQALANAELPVPTSRIVRYRFPGEPDASCSAEFAAMSDVMLGAQTSHSFTLPAGAELAASLGSHGVDATPPSLTFEVRDKSPDCPDTTCASGQLPVAYAAEPLFSGLEAEQSSGSVVNGAEPTAGGVDSSSSDIYAISGPPRALPAPIDAVICVEVVRACGLLAAVNEASVWLGGGAGLLGRAKQAGPHSFVQISLFPSDEQLELRVPPIKTPFQAQTFCPDYRFSQEVPLTLDSRAVKALATQELCLEVHHHCPRSQAVAAALSSGQRRGSRAAQRDVFLGSAAVPLTALLNKPQGLRAWLGLKSRRGEAAGAVQIAIYFTQLGGERVPLSGLPRAPLDASADLCALLPADAPPLRLSGAHDFDGQAARASIFVEEATLPQGEDLKLDRPRAATYHATYRLPGTREQEMTAGRPATATPPAAVVGIPRAWKVALQHCGVHWVCANAALVAALQSAPLAVSLFRQEVSRGSSGAGPKPPPIPVGTAEVDLSPLLRARPSHKQPLSRWLSGTFLLIHPASKHLGNARVRVKVLLELRPPGEAPTGGAAHTAAGAAGSADQRLELAEPAAGVEESLDAESEGGAELMAMLNANLKELDEMALRMQQRLYPTPVASHDPPLDSPRQAASPPSGELPGSPPDKSMLQPVSGLPQSQLPGSPSDEAMLTLLSGSREAPGRRPAQAVTTPNPARHRNRGAESASQPGGVGSPPPVQKPESAIQSASGASPPRGRIVTASDFVLGEAASPDDAAPAVEPPRQLRLARVTTCSDDEDYFVMGDLGGYDSSGSGSSDAMLAGLAVERVSLGGLQLQPRPADGDQPLPMAFGPASERFDEDWIFNMDRSTSASQGPSHADGAPDPRAGQAEGPRRFSADDPRASDSALVVARSNSEEVRSSWQALDRSTSLIRRSIGSSTSFRKSLQPLQDGDESETPKAATAGPAEAAGSAKPGDPEVACEAPAIATAGASTRSGEIGSGSSGALPFLAGPYLSVQPRTGMRDFGTEEAPSGALQLLLGAPRAEMHLAVATSVAPHVNSPPVRSPDGSPSRADDPLGLGDEWVFGFRKRRQGWLQRNLHWDSDDEERAIHKVHGPSRASARSRPHPGQPPPHPTSPSKPPSGLSQPSHTSAANAAGGQLRQPMGAPGMRREGGSPDKPGRKSPPLCISLAREAERLPELLCPAVLGFQEPIWRLQQPPPDTSGRLYYTAPSTCSC
ncbi:hypothetical protein WJX72_002083 [[Myrmecia] bisecta]|uniref:Calmodulin n=1 Tax=[Myrmecia] bisecta TaxID=41462 RepID=A0AAW1Q8B5_9CHLO